MLFDDLEDKLVKTVTELMEYIKMELIKELKAQGHVLTGKTIQSINYDVQLTSNGIIAQMKGNENARRLDEGVGSSKVRAMYAPPTYRGGTSDYIDGLTTYFEDRGFGSESKRLAFATANVAFSTGHPTPNSSRFSNAPGGRRTGFVRHTLESNVPKMKEMLTKDARIAIEAIIKDYTQTWTQKLSA